MEYLDIWTSTLEKKLKPKNGKRESLPTNDNIPICIDFISSILMNFSGVSLI